MLRGRTKSPAGSFAHTIDQLEREFRRQEMQQLLTPAADAPDAPTMFAPEEQKAFYAFAVVTPFFVGVYGTGILPM